LLNLVQIPPAELFAFLAAIAFAAGLNVYATVAVLGLLGRFGHMPLPAGLHLLENWIVIGASIALFFLEFFADKVPAFDLIWNALHTFIRVPVAALIAYQASAQLSPQMKLIAALAGGAVALVSHGSKTAVRAAVTASPEPLSNIALSTGEDVVAIGLTWLTSRHPWVAAVIATTLILCAILAARWIVRILRRAWTTPGIATNTSGP